MAAGLDLSWFQHEVGAGASAFEPSNGRKQWQFPVQNPEQYTHIRPALPAGVSRLVSADRLQLWEKLSFPAWFDNSMLNDFTLCELKGWYSHFKKIQIKVLNEHLHFGGAFAKALETARQSYFGEGAPLWRAEVAGLEALWSAFGNAQFHPDVIKTLDRLEAAYVSFLTTYPLDSDPVVPVILSGKPAIEFGFAIPLPNVRHPETGEPILYVGRFDMLAQFQAAHWVYDDKTATSLGNQFQFKWSLSPQMSGYIWAAQQYGHPVGGALVRGTGILKTEIKHQTVPTYRSARQLEMWLARTEYYIARAIEAWRANSFTPAFNESCSMYRGCQYKMLCESNGNPSALIEQYYAERNWDPMKRNQEQDDETVTVAGEFEQPM